PFTVEPFYDVHHFDHGVEMGFVAVMLQQMKRVGLVQAKAGDAIAMQTSRLQRYDSAQRVADQVNGARRFFHKSFYQSDMIQNGLCLIIRPSCGLSVAE